MKLTKPFICVPPGKIYPRTIAAGEDCPEGLESSAAALGCLSEEDAKTVSDAKAEAAKVAAEADAAAQAEDAEADKAAADGKAKAGQTNAKAKA